MRKNLNTSAVLFMLLAPALLVVATFGGGCVVDDDAIKGSGTIATESRQIAEDFTAVRLNGSSDVNIVVDADAERSVTVRTDDNLLMHIVTKVEAGQLIIETGQSIRPTKGVVVDVTLPSLDAISLNGSGDIKATGISGDALSAGISGSGDIVVKGETKRLVLVVTGSGDIDADGLQSEKVGAELAGSGDIACRTTGKAVLRIAGSGDIVCRGTPTDIDGSERGSGGIRVIRDDDASE